MENNDLNQEFDSIIAEIKEKFNYSDDLSNVLRKILPAMLDDVNVSAEERNLFYRMLRHTPIEIIQEGSGITSDDLRKKHIGEINLETEEADLGEYGKQEAAGAVVSEPIIDKDKQIKGVKQFLYVKSFDTSKLLTQMHKKHYELFGTGIQVSHLIHELGHAWAAEKNSYSIEGDILTERVGTAEIKYKIEDLESGKFSKKEISRTGLMTEEALNTNLEEKSVAKYLGISLEEVKQLYKAGGVLIPSSYQGLMSEITEYLSLKTLPEEINKWRITGDKEALNRINDIMSQTKEYFYRAKETDDLKKKRKIFSNPEGERMAELFEEYNNDFFPDKTNMSPMEIIDNCLLQCFNIKTNLMAFQLEKYSEVIGSIVPDAYILINQTADIINERKNSQINTVSIDDLARNALENGTRIDEINELDNSSIEKIKKAKEEMNFNE